MILQQVLDVLYVLGIQSSEVVLRREGQVQICCPLAKWFHEKGTDNTPSLSIGYSEKRTTLWKCFACGEGGKLWQLVDSLGILSERPELVDLAEKLIVEDKPTLGMTIELACRDIKGWVKIPVRTRRINIHPDAINKRMLPVADIPEARQYLTKREIDADIWRKFNLRYDSYQNRIVFPVYGKDGQLYGGVGRTLLDPCPEDVPKYKNFLGFEATSSLGGINFVRPESKRIIVAEGYFCLLHGHKWAVEHDSDIVCTFHGETSQEQADQLISLGKSVQYWYDNDKTGNEGWEKAQRLLYGRLPSLKRALLPVKVDIGNMQKEKFLDILMQTIRRIGPLRM